jgi:nitrate/nitrite transporter NarK
MSRSEKQTLGINHADFPHLMTMTALIIAGEATFSLPFHVTRFFRPTFLEVFEFSNMQLGLVQASYGVIAMLAYFPGGQLADMYSARKLLAASLVATGLGGFYFAQIPSYQSLHLLFGFWGFTTILLFWGALIRATREWGAVSAQGRAFGILDGGRGLFAALVGVVAVLVFRSFFPDDVALASDAERIMALQYVIYCYTAFTFLAVPLVWLLVPEPTVDLVNSNSNFNANRSGLVRRTIDVMRLPTVWLQSLIIVAAYVGYKGIDNYSLFAYTAYGLNEVEAAELTAYSVWIRPVAAVGAGLLADRILPSRATALCFTLMIICFGFLSFDTPDVSQIWILFANVIVTSAAVFGLRGIYFAMFEEGNVSGVETGTATGLVSVIGFTPDIFMGPMSGWILDRSPGLQGHQDFYLLMACFAFLGLVASVLFYCFARKPALS